MATQKRRYYGRAKSVKCNRGAKTVDLFLDPPNVTRLIEALTKYESESFQACQSGVNLEQIPPVEITMYDGNKTKKEGIFLITVSRRG